MKIGILTQPLHNNYGGLLQAYALQKILKDMGHEPVTLDIRAPEINTSYKLLRSIGSRVIRKYILQQAIDSVIPFVPTSKEKQIIGQHSAKFVSENIQTTDPLIANKIKHSDLTPFEAFIVGSDQVWRPAYSPNIFTFFLDFIPEKTKIKRIAYAASFGVDYWEFNQKQTTVCRKLAGKFDAISVREDTAVELCRNYLKVEAFHLPDPTLLLSSEEYIQLTTKEQIPSQKNSLMMYVLDKSQEKKAIVKKIQNQLNLPVNSVMPSKTLSKENRKDVDQCIFPPVSQWIKGFYDADFVVTDSFHGTVFSIIFNKPFISIANSQRGTTRFTSLLKLFGLENRLIVNESEVTPELIKAPIDYEQINKIREEKKVQAFRFLKEALN
jgi:polysaccharide pyruvyl transferase WcaK-like protein